MTFAHYHDLSCMIRLKHLSRFHIPSRAISRYTPSAVVILSLVGIKPEVAVKQVFAKRRCITFENPPCAKTAVPATQIPIPTYLYIL